MFTRIYQLFVIARKLASSGAIETINEIYNIPFIVKIFFNFISIGSKKPPSGYSKKPGEKLCDALEGMGTTFIKLGQFLATRPDIIGEQLANDLVKLFQDRDCSTFMKNNKMRIICAVVWFLTVYLVVLI